MGLQIPSTTSPGSASGLPGTGSSAQAPDGLGALSGSDGSRKDAEGFPGPRGQGACGWC